jgi:hypothetical protein
MHMHRIRLEKDVEIYAKNTANKTKCMSINAKKWKHFCEDLKYLLLVTSVE